MSTKQFTGSLEERRERYIAIGSAVRSSNKRPDYLSTPADGIYHVTLGVEYDPVFYMPRPVPPYIMNDDRLNLTVGIMEDAVSRSSGLVPWHNVDWEVVPDQDESIREAYLAWQRDDTVTSRFLLISALDKHQSSGIVMPYLALASQPNSTYVLPDLRITFKGDAASSIPMFSAMIQRVLDYISEHDVKFVAEDVYEYFGLRAYLENRKPYLVHDNVVSLPDLISNEVLICKRDNPKKPLEEILKRVDPSLLIVYAKASMHLQGKVPDTFGFECLEVVTEYNES
jgi:hypothetical protein